MIMVKYKDITKEMLKEASLNPTKPIYVCKYIKEMKDGTIIIYDESNAKFDKRRPKNDELRTINTLVDRLGWNIEIIYRINKDGISTPDIRRIQGGIEYWDIKNIYMAKTDNSKNNKIRHAIDDGKKQAVNFVIDLNNIDCNITNKEAIKQLKIVFNNSRYNSWLNRIVLLGKNNFIKIFQIIK